MSPLSLLFGAVVGLSLGLTGGGGAIFAVPLLVYGLDVPAREAVGISLASVGATSLVGFLKRWLEREVEIRPGILFAIAGMIGAPLGTWLNAQLPQSALLTSFGLLMVVVAVRMWLQAAAGQAPPAGTSANDAQDGPTCRRNELGELILSTPCALKLLAIGVLVGTLSGMFGVGGGFVIVPALVMFSGMSMRRAVGTSLMVITLVSVSGVGSFLWGGGHISPVLTTQFIIGGIAGLLAGQTIGTRLSGPALQRLFAVAIVAVAAFVIFKNTRGL